MNATLTVAPANAGSTLPFRYRYKEPRQIAIIHEALVGDQLTQRGNNTINNNIQHTANILNDSWSLDVMSLLMLRIQIRKSLFAMRHSVGYFLSLGSWQGEKGEGTGFRVPGGAGVTIGPPGFAAQSPAMHFQPLGQLDDMK